MSRPKPWWPLLPSFVFLTVGCQTERSGEPAEIASGSILLEGARLIPGDGGEPIESSALLVEDGVIREVGRRGEVAPSDDVRRVDLSGKTVMPAMIGAHGHPGYQRGGTFSSDVYSRDTLLDDLARAAYFGVGTVLSMGIDPGDLAFDVRAETADGALGVARLLTAGRGIGAPNAGPGFATWAGIAYEVTNEEEARRAARELAERRVDVLKIWVDDRGGRAPALGAPLYRAIIEEGRSVGLPVTAHVFYHQDAVDLVESGVHAFAHMPRDLVVDDELVDAIVRGGVYVMPNLGSQERSTQTTAPWTSDPYLLELLEATVTPELVQRVRQSYENRVDSAAAAARERYAILEASLARLNAAGARIVLGADTGLQDHFFGYAEQRELELMVRAGMTPAQAIVAATGNAAAYLGRNDLGVLAPGMRADLLVLDANPLEDIRNLRRISEVYLSGEAIDREGLARELAPRAAAP